MDILDRITAHKKNEVQKMPDFSESELCASDRDFVAVLSSPRDFPHLIAEIKPKSPAKGAILPFDFSVSDLAKTFEQGGVSAISVLTDAEFFGGSFENLRLAKSATQKTPILCKDFIISRQQIRAARFFGADAFLLIARILSREVLFDLLEYGRTFHMTALLEITDEEDLEKIQNLGARVVGINNRDLRNFSVDLGRTFTLAKKLPPETIVASLSGFSGADVRFIRGISHAVLVGSSLGKSSNISQKIKSLTHPDWLKKFCGVRKFSDFSAAKKSGASIFGLNFVENSRRKITEKVARKISKNKGDSKLFGVFRNSPADFCRRKCTEFSLDFCQLHGAENPADFQNFSRPIVRALSLTDEKTILTELKKWEDIADLWLFDGKNPGSGMSFDFALFEKIRGKITKPFFIAGGITPQNFVEMAKKCGADGVDMASGIENEEGEWDAEKISAFILEKE